MSFKSMETHLVRVDYSLNDKVKLQRCEFYFPVWLLVTNPCKINNGGCSHLCLLAVAKSHVCRCPNGMNLTSGGTTCTGTPITEPVIPSIPSTPTTPLTTASTSTRPGGSITNPSQSPSTTKTPTPSTPTTSSTRPTAGTKSNGSVVKASKAPVTGTTQNTEHPSTTQNPTEPGVVAAREGKVIYHLVSQIIGSV